MGIIQGSINNLLATAGLAARLSPHLEEMREEKRELQQTKKAYEKTESLLDDTDFETYNEEIAKTQTERARRIAELDPTEQNIRTYVAEAGGYESVKPESLKAEREATYAQRARIKAQKDAEEALRIRQEEASNAFRQMFTEGGRYK